MVQLSDLYIITVKTIALTVWNFVGKVMSLLFNMLSRFVIASLPRSKRLSVSWLQSLSAVIFGAQEDKVKVKVAQLCLTVCDPMNYSPWTSPGQNIGVGSLSLLQGIFPTQRSNPVGSFFTN